MAAALKLDLNYIDQDIPYGNEAGSELDLVGFPPLKPAYMVLDMRTKKGGDIRKESCVCVLFVFTSGVGCCWVGLKAVLLDISRKRVRERERERVAVG